MPKEMSDAFVFFGATGDLAYKQIFPSLQDLIRDEGFNVPIIGVAKAGWTLDQLKERAKESLEEHGGLEQAPFEKLVSLLRYVDGDYDDAATFTELRKQLGEAQASAALSGRASQPVRHGGRRPCKIRLRHQRTGRRREAFRSQSAQRRRAQSHSA